MPRLSSFSGRGHFLNKNQAIAGVAMAGWTVLNTGLSTEHTIGEPTQYFNSGAHHFPLIGGSSKILRYSPVLDPSAGTFTSSTSNVDVLDSTVIITSNTSLSNTSENGGIFGLFDRTFSASPLTYISAFRTSTEGYSYGTLAGGGSTWLAPSNVGQVVDLSTNSTSFFAVDRKGNFGRLSSNSISLTFTGANSSFTANSDCRTVISDGTNYVMAGGNGATGKIVIIPIASLVSSTTAWTVVSNTFGQAISKLGFVSVYVNAQPHAPNPVNYTVTGAKTSVLLAGGVDGKIARSLDGGLTWTASNTQPFTTGDVVTGFSAGDVVIIAVTSTGKVATSTNGGSDWALVNIGVAISGLSFAVKTGSSPNRLYIGGANAFLATRALEGVIQT
jgi:hypothetical protein